MASPTPLAAVVAQLERLVAFDTVSRHSNLALVEYIHDYLREQGVVSEILINREGTKANLLASVGPMVPGGVVLSGHTDVVPVDGQPWTSDPFQLTERDGRYYGRGTCDMKGFIALALALVPEMNYLRRPVHFAFSYDEEVGCRGAPELIATLKRQVPTPAAVIVGEPTGMQLITAHKGIAVARTQVIGREAHSSLPHSGVSAVMVGGRLIARVADLAAQRELDGPHCPGFEPSHTTLHVGTVRGGTAVNIVARECVFDWDIRTIPGDDAQQIIDDFRHQCSHDFLPAMHRVSAATGINTELLVSAPPFAHEPDNPATALVASILGTTETGHVAYATEAGLFQQAGLACVVCGPGSIEQAHQPDEYISGAQLSAGQEFLRALIAELS